MMKPECFSLSCSMWRQQHRINECTEPLPKSGPGWASTENLVRWALDQYKEIVKLKEQLVKEREQRADLDNPVWRWNYTCQEGHEHSRRPGFKEIETGYMPCPTLYIYEKGNLEVRIAELEAELRIANDDAQHFHDIIEADYFPTELEKLAKYLEGGSGSVWAQLPRMAAKHIKELETR